MSCWLKQSTAVDVMLGPFLDSADGNTVEGGLTITQPDIRLSKNGGAFAQKSAAQTLTHGENGWYPANLSTTDTNTLGILIVAVHESGALPVWREFLVVPANIYDSFFSTDLLQVDLTQWLGVAPLGLSSQLVRALMQDTGAGAISSGSFAAGAINAAAIASDAITAAKIASGAIDAATFAAGAIDAAAIADGAIDAGALASDTITAAKIAADAITAAKIAAGAIDDDAVAADMDAYHAKVWVVKESTTADHYAVVFFKNGQPVTTGITSPTIQVIKASDGTDLIASGALTEVGALGIYKKDESTNKMVGGAIYFAKVQATIDGSSRQWLQQIGRDSA